jgi:hypothetical protein
MKRVQAQSRALHVRSPFERRLLFFICWTVDGPFKLMPKSGGVCSLAQLICLPEASPKVGRTLLDIFRVDFRDRSASYYVSLSEQLDLF